MQRPHLDNEQLKEVREGVDWRQLFEQLAIQKDEKRSSPDDWWGFSPFNPEERNASFHMNDNGWYCHSTAQGGGPIELVQSLESCSCFDAARWLLDRGVSSLRTRSRRSMRKRGALADKPGPGEPPAPDNGEPADDLPENPPIRQDLRPLLTFRHPAFEERGISPAVPEGLGVGYYAEKEGSRSPMAGRLVFQIRGVVEGEDGKPKPVILSHIGRATTEQQEEEHGKWLFYSGFRASLELYNVDTVLLDREAIRQAKETGRIIVVEGCFDVIKLCSAGIRNVVATFGAHLSGAQASKLRRAVATVGAGRVLVFFDRDQDGSSPNREGTRRALERLDAADLESESFDWSMTFQDRRRGLVGIPKPIADPCDFTAEQLRWLRGRGVL
jgi:hypothetical protein